MNGKMSKMMRKMHSADKRSKRLFKALDWHARTKVRRLFRDGKLDEARLLVAGV